MRCGLVVSGRMSGHLTDIITGIADNQQLYPVGNIMSVSRSDRVAAQTVLRARMVPMMPEGQRMTTGISDGDHYERSFSRRNAVEKRPHKLA